MTILTETDGKKFLINPKETVRKSDAITLRPHSNNFLSLIQKPIQKKKKQGELNSWENIDETVWNRKK